MNCIALIPARAESKRVPDKNIKVLAGHPLIAYAIAGAKQSGVFEQVLVSTNSERYAEIARHYGAWVPFLRPQEYAGDTSPDIQWVFHALEWLEERSLEKQGHYYECFSILRPVNPFRRPETIRRAWAAFQANAERVDSLRAVQVVTEHPAKMWRLRGTSSDMVPLLPFEFEDAPWHDNQYGRLPTVYVQNASLEIAKTDVVLAMRRISGRAVMPFMTRGYEGFDINLPQDWAEAQRLVATGDATLPRIEQEAWRER